MGQLQIIGWSTKQDRMPDPSLPFEMARDKNGLFTLCRRFHPNGERIPGRLVKEHREKVATFDEVLERILTLEYSLWMKHPRVRTRSVLRPQSIHIRNEQHTASLVAVAALHAMSDAIEGQRKNYTVGVRYRSEKLRNEKIELFKRLNGDSLFCEICEGKSHDIYGNLHESCLQCHHLEPIGERPASGSATTLQALVILCANCHNILERTNPRISIAELKRLMPQD